MYILYKTTNLINDKIYIGVHKTHDYTKFDSYLGSGHAIKHAISKYGRRNFIRKTLVVSNQASYIYALEKKLVTLDFINLNSNYNLCCGGARNDRGLFSASEETRKKISAAQTGKVLSEDTKRKISEAHIGLHDGENNSMYGKIGKLSPCYGTRRSLKTRKLMAEQKQGKYSGTKNPFWGKTHTEESKRKMSLAKGGSGIPKSSIANPIAEVHSKRLSIEQLLERFTALLNSKREWGWKTKLAQEWNVVPTSVRDFIKVHDNESLPNKIKILQTALCEKDS